MTFRPYVQARRAAAFAFDSLVVLALGLTHPVHGLAAGGLYFMLRDGVAGGRLSFKRPLGLRVLQAATGAAATPFQSLVRNATALPVVLGLLDLVHPAARMAVVPALGVFCLLVLLEEVVCIGRCRARSLDGLAGTAVVQVDQGTDLPTWAVVGLAVAPVVALLLVRCLLANLDPLVAQLADR